VELTDTFCGEANYGWVRRYVVAVKTESRRAIMRAAKRAAGLSGMRGKTEDHGETIAFTPYRQHTVLFVTAAYS